MDLMEINGDVLSRYLIFMHYSLFLILFCSINSVKKSTARMDALVQPKKSDKSWTLHALGVRSLCCECSGRGAGLPSTDAGSNKKKKSKMADNCLLNQPTLWISFSTF